MYFIYKALCSDHEQVVTDMLFFSDMFQTYRYLNARDMETSNGISAFF